MECLFRDLKNCRGIRFIDIFQLTTASYQVKQYAGNLLSEHTYMPCLFLLDCVTQGIVQRGVTKLVSHATGGPTPMFARSMPPASPARAACVVVSVIDFD